MPENLEMHSTEYVSFSHYRNYWKPIYLKRFIAYKLGILKLLRIPTFIKLFLKNIKKHSQKKNLSSLAAEKLGVDVNKIEIVDHHLLHILASFYFVDTNKKYLCFSIDGIGDNLSAKVGIWENNKFTTLSQTIGSTLGAVYMYVTLVLGMKPLEHEFKVMGMASYAKAEYVEKLKKVFYELLWLDENGNFVSKVKRKYSIDYLNFLIDKLMFERFDNICGAVQVFTEEILTQWIRFWVNKTGIKDITLGGGVMMNVKAAKKIYEMPEINSVFVTPSAGDESLVIGGLFYANNKSNIPMTKITDLYLGRQNAETEIENYLKSVSDRYTYEKMSENELACEVAKLLAQNNVVARCAGREEWGARALGNRSILCNASHFKNIDILNQYIKDRDFWMPFTPSILKEDIDKYIINPRKMPTPYMCITFDSTELAQKHIPAALHPYDHTIRPQAVDSKTNPSYHKLLLEFKKLTGISGLLNTSFNLHGQPNVSSIADAIFTLDNSKLQYLAVENFLVRKK